LTPSSFSLRPYLVAPLILCLLSTAVVAGDPPAQGTIPLAGAVRLKIAAFGRIRIEAGAPGDAIGYRWIGTPASLAYKSSGAWRIVSVARSASAPPPGELHITLPPSLVQVYAGSDQGAIFVRGLTGTLEVVTLAGDIDVRDLRGTVTARTGGGEMTFASIGGALRSFSDGGSIRVESASAEASLQTAGGDIFVGRVQGPLRATTSGNIQVRDAASTVAVHTSGGLIEIIRARGAVTAENGGGSIVVGSAPSVHAESAGGGIRLKAISGPARATTSTGPIVATFTRNATLATSFLSAGSGDLTVFLPSNISVTVKALNESSGWKGGIESDFPDLRSRQPASGFGTAYAELNLNGGGSLLMLSVSSGSIFVKRAR
jgi:hypothetical protein